MPRYVILHHETPPDGERPTHWDLMIESRDVLRTWALERPPTSRPTSAQQLADHRVHYLDYEGEVSGGRGRVTRWDHGEYELLEETRDTLVLRCRGERLLGLLRLTREGHWVVVCEFEAAESDL